MIKKDLIQIMDLFNSKYKCSICRRRLRYKADEIIHRQNLHNHKRTSFSCSFCDKPFNSFYMLRQHLMMVHLNEKPYQCRICKKKFSQFLHLKKHCRKHVTDKLSFHSMIEYENSRIVLPNPKINDKKSIFIQFSIIAKNPNRKCSECSVNFFTDAEYLLHIWTEHMKCLNLVCWKCNTNFLSIKSLLIHLNEHLDDKKFNCLLCNNNFGTFENAKDHYVEFHLKSNLIPLFKLVCSNCNENIDESTSMQHFEKCSPSSNIDYFCVDCNLTFYNRQLFELHKIQHKSLKQQTLNKSFLIDSIISPANANKSVGGLKIDNIALKILSMKQKKIDIEREETLVQYSPFLIHPCQKTSFNNNTIKLSASRLNLPIEFSKYILEKKWLDDQLLTKENLTKYSLDCLSQTNTMYQCDLCGFSFKTIFELNSHKYSHLTTNNKRPFRCHLCMVTFSKSDQLKRHMIVHKVKEQDSVCQICFSSFSRKQDLDRHLLFHSK